MVYLHSFDELYLTSTFDTSVFDAVICELHDKVKHNLSVKTRYSGPTFPSYGYIYSVNFTVSSNIYTHHFSSVFVADVHVSAN